MNVLFSAEKGPPCGTTALIKELLSTIWYTLPWIHLTKRHFNKEKSEYSNNRIKEDKKELIISI